MNSSGACRVIAVLVGGLGLLGITHQSLAAVGVTAGQAGVGANGSAGYEIPLVLPPGSNGLTPSLALRYNSNGGNGLMGVGWTVGGLSGISRCDKTIAQDGAITAAILDVNDGYCLDGNRLRLTGGTYGTSGSTYQSEVETFSRITAQGAAGSGPAWWEVRGKDGLIYEYGNTTDSRIETVNSTTARFWALNKIRDRTGNYIEFVYIEDTTNGSFRPSEIRYTGNSSVGTSPTTKVVFVYETVNRTDPIYKFHFGINGTSIEGQINEFKRLDRIDVVDINTATTVRTFELSYEASGGAGGRARLSSIQECRGTDCLAATNLQWINGTPSWASNEVSTGVSIPTGATILVGDINGDGRGDLIFSSSPTSGSGTWWFMLGSDTGFGTATNTGITNWNQAYAQGIEWNGDGLVDVLVPCNGASTWCVLQSTGSGFTSIDTGTPATGYNGNVLAADVDGDGRDDLVRIMDSQHLGLRLHGASGFGSETTAWSAPLGNFAFNGTLSGMVGIKLRSIHRRVDFNGDGREDLAIAAMEVEPDGPNIYYIASFFSTGSGFVGGEAFGTKFFPIAIGDFNGDGLSDPLIATTGFYAIPGQGTSFGTSIAGPSTSGLSYSWTLVLDYDGDGLDDIVVPKISPATWQVSRSTGNGFAALVDTGIPVTTTGNVTLAADVNGDGLGDICRTDVNIVKSRLHNGVVPDLLDRLTDGFGMYVDFSYSSLTSGGATYTKGSGAVYPTIEYQGPKYVVSSYTSTDGAGGTYSMTYSYQQARMHLQGRGYLGFNKRTTTDSRNGVRVEETYLQDPAEYQAIGAPSLVQVKQSSGTLIRQITNNWLKLTYSSGTSERRFPYIATQVVERHEVQVGGPYNGNIISTATTTNTVDSTSGTVYDSTTATVEATTANGLQASASYSARVYHPQANLLNDTTNWCIGRPGQTQFINSHTQYGGGSVTRTVNRTWDGVQCRVTQEVTEPGSSQWQVTRDLGYDSWGNLNSDAVTGIGMTARTTTASYAATNGRFPSSITNPLSQTTQLGWDQTIGVLTSQQDPNGLTVSWQYDNFGRRTREDRPDGTATTWQYSLCTSGCDSRVRMYIYEQPRDSANGIIRTNQLYFDQLNRRLYEYRQMLDGNYSVTTRNYDSLGRVVNEYFPYLNGAVSTYYSTLTYDLLDRATQVSRPVSDSDATIQTTNIYYEGLTTRVVDALAKQRTEIANVRGEVIRSLDHSGNYQNFDFDAFGNPVRVVDNAGNTLQSSTFNVRGMRTAATDMDMGSWTFTPNALGEVVSQTDAKTQNTTFVYDALGRLSTRTEPEGTSTFTWGTSAAAKNIGRLASLSGPGYSESYTYDSAGRPSTTTIVSDATYAIDYAYNSQGLINTLTYPTSTSSYRLKLQYDYQYGLLTGVKDFNAPSTVFWHATAGDARGNVIDETLGNGLRTIRGIDQVTGLLDSITTGPGGGTSIQNLAYAWDKAGNLTQRQDLRQNLTEAFFYDNLHRLDHSTLNGTQNLTLAYDPSGLGNITSKTSTDPTANVGSYTYHASKKHAVTAAGSYTFGYDANGNVSSRNGSTITWYSYNLPNTISATGSNSSQFFYSPTRARWKQVASYAGTAETTIYIGGLLEKVTRSGVTSYKHLIAGGSGPVAVYTRKSDGTNQTHYLTRDHLGSVDSVTNSSGAIEVRLAFGSFGQRRKEAGWSGAVPSADLNQITATTRHGFTFHELLDNLALTHMNGRVYDQVVGRFLSADPFVPAPLSTQSYNRYSYTHNNPLSFTDPSGFAEGDELPCCGNGWNNVPTTGHPEDNPRNPGAEERVAKYDAEQPLPAPTAAGDRRIGQGPDFTPSARFTLGDHGELFFSIMFPPLDRAGQWMRERWTVLASASDSAQSSLTRWWNATSTQSVCDVVCAKVTGQVTWNTATNGERVLNTVMVLASIIPAAPLEEGGLLAARGTGILANSVRGRAAEARVLQELGLTKNTMAVATAEGRSVPDALTTSLSLEVKDAASVSLTRQLRIQTEAARAAGRKSVLATGENTCISDACSRAFDTIIRRSDLGPQ
jgi:RHS repeat-associated protein